MTDRFDPDSLEDSLRVVLRRRAEPAEPDLVTLEAFARALPARPARPLRRYLLAAAAVAVLIAGAGFTFERLQTASTTSPTPRPPTAQPSIPTARPATPLPSGTLQLADPALWADDARMQQCMGAPVAGATFEALTAYELARASEYRQRLPSLGFQSVLELADPALVVVYRRESPLIGGWGSIPEAPQYHSPKAGMHDVCIVVPSRLLVYHDVAIDWSYLAGVAVPPAPEFFERTVATLPGAYLAMGMDTNAVWDASRRLLWWAFANCGAPQTFEEYREQESSIFSFDPATGDVRRWPIPAQEESAMPCTWNPSLVLDAAGGLWVLESTRVVRFDPATHSSATVPLHHSLDQAWPLFPVSIAADGSGVVVRHLNEASLMRIDADLRVTTVPLPGQLVGTDGERTVVSGGRLYVLSHGDDVLGPKRLDVVSLDGTLLASTGVDERSLDVMPDGRVVLWRGDGTGVIVDEHAAVVGPVTLAPELRRAVQLRGATDWQSRAWYVAAQSPFGRIVVAITRQ